MKSNIPPATVASLLFMKWGFVSTICRYEVETLTSTNICNKGGITANLATLQPACSLASSLIYVTSLSSRMVPSRTTAPNPIERISSLSGKIKLTSYPMNAEPSSTFTAKFFTTTNTVSATRWAIGVTSHLVSKALRRVPAADRTSRGSIW